MSSADLEMAGRLSLAALLGGLVGLEREFHHQPAGLRTYMIVAIGSCLMMLVSIHVSTMYTPHPDPGRIAAQVVAGVGFLGAGAIIRSGLSVRGLTTAAALWTTAGVGLATGCGYWKGAISATALTLVAMYTFMKVERRISKGRFLRKFIVQARDSAALVQHLEDILQKSGVMVQEVDIRRDLVEKRIQVTVTAVCPANVDVDHLSLAMGKLPEVEKVEIE